MRAQSLTVVTGSQTLQTVRGQKEELHANQGGGDLAVMETEELFDYAATAFRSITFLSFLPSKI